MAADDRPSAALGQIRGLVTACDALVERMKTALVSTAEFNAAQDRLAECVPRLLAALDAVVGPQDRERLGSVVREAWTQWAAEHPAPKQSWLVPWEELDDGQREVDMRIGEAIAAYFAAAITRALLGEAQ